MAIGFINPFYKLATEVHRAAENPRGILCSPPSFCGSLRAVFETTYYRSIKQEDNSGKEQLLSKNHP